MIILEKSIDIKLIKTLSFEFNIRDNECSICYDTFNTMSRLLSWIS
jgi:hypothetical protein